MKCIIFIAEAREPPETAVANKLSLFCLTFSLNNNLHFSQHSTLIARTGQCLVKYEKITFISGLRCVSFHSSVQSSISDQCVVPPLLNRSLTNRSRPHRRSGLRLERLGPRFWWESVQFKQCKHLQSTPILFLWKDPLYADTNPLLNPAFDFLVNIFWASTLSWKPFKSTLNCETLI